MGNPVAQVYKDIMFRNKIIGLPIIQKQNSENVLPLSQNASVTNTRPDDPRPTARHRRSRPGVCVKIPENANSSLEIDSRIRLIMRACLTQFRPES